MNRSRRLLAAAVTVAAVLGALTLASAASLPLTGPILTAATVPHPCPGTATAVPATRSGNNNNSYLAVVMALPPGCGNRFVQLTVDRPNTTTRDRTGSGTTDANGRVTITLNDTYNVTANNTLLATVSGWNLPAAWAPQIWCTVVDSSGATCAATVTLGVRNGNDLYHVSVTTPSTSWVTWEVTFNLAHAFYGAVPTRLGNGDLDQYSDGAVNWDYTMANVNDVVRSSLCATFPGELRVTGLTSGSSPNVFNQVTSGRTRVFDLLVNVTQAGYYDVIAPNCV